MALTTVEMETNLANANAAYAAALNSLQYTVGNRSKTNQKVKDLREEITFWTSQIAKANRGGIQIRGISTV
jgi:DNA anti-recombination protein RmuC